MNDFRNTFVRIRKIFQQYSWVDFFIFGLFLFAFGYSTWALHLGWNTLIIDSYGFRQTQTAITVQYLLRGASWLAYETPVYGPPWTIPYEFPLFQWIVALIVKIFSTPIDQTGRSISILFYYFSIFPILIILSEIGIKKRKGLLFVTLYLLSPFYLFWSRTFLIESTAIFFGLAYAASIFVYMRTERLRFAVYGTVFGIICALVKITTFPPFVLLVIMNMFHSWRTTNVHSFSWPVIRKFGAKCIFFILLPLAFMLLWTHYADSLKSSTIIGQSLTSRNLREWNFGTLEQKKSWIFWKTLIYRSLPEFVGYWIHPYYLWFTALSFSFIGRKMNKENAKTLFSFVLFLFTVLLFSNLHFVHNYYQYSVGIFLLAALGFFIVSNLQRGGLYALIGLAVLLFYSASAVHGFYHRYYQEIYVKKNIDYAQFVEPASLIVQQNTKSDDVIFIYGFLLSSEIPYYADRRAVAMYQLYDLDSPAFKELSANLEPYHIGGLLSCRLHGFVMPQDMLQKLIKKYSLRDVPVNASSLCEFYPSIK